MPRVLFGTTDAEVSGLAVTLALGDAPILEVLIENRKEFDTLELLRMSPQCHVEWDQNRFPFELLGFEPEGVGQGDLRTRVIGRCGDHAARQWFTATALGPDRSEVAYVLYQRGLGEEAQSYFTRMFASALRSAGTDFASLSNSPKPLGCIVRDSAIDNRTHLNRVCRLLSKSVPQLLGWWANAKEEEFVQLAVSGQQADADLTDGWIAAAGTRLSGYDDKTMRRRPLILRRTFRNLAKPQYFLSQLLLAEDADWGGISEGATLPSRPGSFSFGDRRWICGKIRYEVQVPGFVSNPAAGSVLATVTLDMPHSDAEADTTRLWVDGIVRSWSADGGQLELQSPKGGNWIAIAEPGKVGPLLAVPLSPTGFSQDRGHTGFYTRHLAGDTLVVAIDGTGVPRAVGGPQARNAAIDDSAFDLVLGAAKVGLLTSGAQADPGASDGVVAAGPKTAVSGDELSIFGKTLVVTPGEVEASGDVKVHGTFDATP